MYYTKEDYTQMFLMLGFNVPRGSKGLVRCPLHRDAHPSMSIDLNKGLFNCFSCGYKGRIDKLYREEYGEFDNSNEIDINSLNQQLKIRRGNFEAPKEKKFFNATIDSYEDKTILKNWLRYRGIKESVALNSGVDYGVAHISYIDDDGNKKSYNVYDRVMIPILNKERKLYSIEMRFPFTGDESLDFKKSIKKVLYPKCSSVDLLFEEYNLNKNKRLYVLEGLMDCLAFRSLTGLMNSTSIFGARLTKNQETLLNRYPEICYIYNNDKAGKESLQQMKDIYKGNFFELKPAENYDDVGEMAQNRFKEVNKWLKMITKR